MTVIFQRFIFILAMLFIAPGVFSEPVKATFIVGGEDCNSFGKYYGRVISPSEFHSQLNEVGGIWDYLSNSRKVVFCSEDSLTEYLRAQAERRDSFHVVDISEFISQNAAVVPRKMASPFSPAAERYNDNSGLLFAFQHQLGMALGECEDRQNLASCVNGKFSEIDFDGVLFEATAADVLYMRGSELPLMSELSGKYFSNGLPFHPKLFEYMSEYIDEQYENNQRWKGGRLWGLVASGFWLKAPNSYILKYMSEYLSRVSFGHPSATLRILFGFKVIDSYLDGWSKDEAISFTNNVYHLTSENSETTEPGATKRDPGMMLARNINAWARFRMEEIDGKINEERLAYYMALAERVDISLADFESRPSDLHFYDQIGILAGSIYRHGVEKALVGSPSFQKFFLRELEEGRKIFSECSNGKLSPICISLSWAAQDFYYKLQGRNNDFDYKALDIIKISLQNNCTKMNLEVPSGSNGRFPRYSCKHSLAPLNYSTPMLSVPAN